MPSSPTNQPAGHPTVQPGPPALPPTGFGVDFNLVPAVVDDAPTIHLHAACRVPGEYVRNYGAKVRQAAFIGAVDRKTGAAYVADGSTPHSVPLDMEILRRLPPPKPEDPEVLASEQTFAIDLPNQLGLPAIGGEFAVLVWIDRLVSRVKTVVVPPNPARHPAPVSAALPAGLSPINFGRKQRSPAPVPGKIQLAGSFEEQPFGIGHAYGSIGAGVFPKDAKAAFVTFFASVFFTREAAAASALVPNEMRPGEDFFTDVEVGSLFPNPNDRRRSFCLAVANLAVSDIVTVDPKR